MRIVFMGSPAFAVPCLQALIESEHAVVAVVTQPDRPAGRGMAPRAPAVKELALQHGLPVLQPESVRKPPFADELTALSPDVAVVVAYGKILPENILATPRHGCLNVHASLLPKYRGAGPIQWALIRGETETGVTLMQMDAGMDTGPMLLQRKIPIGDDVTAAVLQNQLASLGSATLTEGLELLAERRLVPRPQDSALATLAPRLSKEDGRIDFVAGARAVRNRVRGCDPWPGTYTTLPLGDRAETLKVFAAKIVSGNGEPGVVMGADRDGLLVGCGADAVAFAALQLPGGKRLSAEAFLAGHPIAVGTRLGD